MPLTRSELGPPVDTSAIRATVSRALVEGPPPRYETLVELEGLLRGHIRLLLPYAEAAVGALWRGSVAWYDRRTRLDDVYADLDRGLGDGLVSARRQVVQLARTCRVLLHYTEDQR